MVPSLASPIALVAGATQVVKAAGPSQYQGIVVRETAGTGCVLRIWDNGSAASGTLIDIVAVGANAVVSNVLPVQVWVSNGIFIERVSGTTYEGSIFTG